MYMYGWVILWSFKAYLWNSMQEFLPIHWKIQFLYNVEIFKLTKIIDRDKIVGVKAEHFHTPHIPHTPHVFGLYGQ